METETKKEGNSTLPAPSGPSSAATSIDEYDEGSLESEFSNFASIDMADIIVELEQCHTIAIKEPALVNKMDTSASHYQLRDLLHFSSIEPTWFYVSTRGGLYRLTLHQGTDGDNNNNNEANTNAVDDESTEPAQEGKEKRERRLRKQGETNPLADSLDGYLSASSSSSSSSSPSLGDAFVPDPDALFLPSAFQTEWQRAHGLACAFGFLGIVSGSELIVYWERSAKIVHQQAIPTGGQTNSIMFDRWGDRLVIVIGQNGGVIRVIELELSEQQQQLPWEEWVPPFTFKQRQEFVVEYNINFVAVDAEKRMLMAAPDHASAPVFFELDATNAHIKPTPIPHLMHYSVGLPTRDKSSSSPEKYRLVAPRTLKEGETFRGDSMQVAWAPIGSLCAAVLDGGLCFVWDWASQQEVAAFCAVEYPATQAYYNRIVFQPIRLVKFSPSSKYPVLAFAELSTYIHIIRTKTMKRQILELPMGSQINGLAFSKDGSKLFVAHSYGVAVFKLVPRDSLVDLCAYFIANHRINWQDWGWELDFFPEEVRERIEQLL